MKTSRVRSRKDHDVAQQLKQMQGLSLLLRNRQSLSLLIFLTGLKINFVSRGGVILNKSSEDLKPLVLNKSSQDLKPLVLNKTIFFPSLLHE